MTSSNACHYHISDGSDTLKPDFGSTIGEMGSKQVEYWLLCYFFFGIFMIFQSGAFWFRIPVLPDTRSVIHMLQNLKDQTWHKNPSKNLGFCRYIHTWILSHKLRYQENMLQKESNKIPDEFKSNFQTAYYMYNIRSKCLYFCNIYVS